MMSFFRFLFLGGMYTFFTCRWRGWRGTRFWMSITSNSSFCSYRRFTFFNFWIPSLNSFMVKLLYHGLHQFKGLKEIIFRFEGTQFPWRIHLLLMRSPLNLLIKSLKLAFSLLEFCSHEHPVLDIPIKPSKTKLWYHKCDKKMKVLLINHKLV